MNLTAAPRTLDPTITSTITAKSSAGLILKASNGTTVATIGAGPGTGVTFAGGVNAQAIAGTTLTASGLISTTATGAFLAAVGATTSGRWFTGANTGGQITVGVEASTAGANFTGSLGYDSVVYSTTRLYLYGATGVAINPVAGSVTIAGTAPGPAGPGQVLIGGGEVKAAGGVTCAGLISTTNITHGAGSDGYFHGLSTNADYLRIHGGNAINAGAGIILFGGAFGGGFNDVGRLYSGATEILSWGTSGIISTVGISCTTMTASLRYLAGDTPPDATTQSITLWKSGPYTLFDLVSSSASANERIWSWRHTGTLCEFAAAPDNYATSTALMQMTRSGATPGQVVILGTAPGTPSAGQVLIGGGVCAAATGFNVGANQVVGARGAAVADAGAGSGTATSGGWGFTSEAEFNAFITAFNAMKDQLNAALARLRAHGLIAT